MIFYDFFSPAFKGGGVIRSLDNLCKSLSERCELYVYTSHTDLGSSVALSVESDQWVNYSPNVKVWYSQASTRGLGQIRTLLMAIRPDVVYINGMFTPAFVLFPLLVHKRLPFSARWVIAPRGMLQQGALSVKPFKKKLYLSLFKLLNLQRDIHWHATDGQEIVDIRSVFGQEAKAAIASNLPNMHFGNVLRLEKRVGQVHLVFISLITAKKNIKALLVALQQIPASIQVVLDVYGPIKDAAYWSECQAAISSLPENVQFTYHGEISPVQVTQTIQNAHFFVLPTLGENFGHAIYEAFHAGRPVIITDKTPWRNLQQYPAGWDYPLKNPENLSKLIIEAAQLDQATFDQYCDGAQQVASQYVKENDFVNQYKELFGF